ncbi:MAG TPA: hypothetical protein VF646_09200 [Cytophagales bacterium]|jgi:hypothetical protein
MLINRYVATSRSRVVRKEMAFLLGYARRYFRHGFRPRTLLFYPDYPLWETEIFKIARRLDYNVTNNPRLPFDLAFAWEDATRRRPVPELVQFAGRVPVVNARCTDISKTKVEAVFRSVFRYGSFVNPTTGRGLAVQKSDHNARHDGRIIELPIAGPEPGYVYQKLLNHVDAGGLAVDFRVTVFGAAIPYVTLRYKPLQTRFTNTVRATLADPGDIFSAVELQNIRHFCRRLGLDYGELDVIRHQDDGRLYILDANNTPWSPPLSVDIAPAERQRMLDAGVAAFRENFLETPAGHPMLRELLMHSRLEG